MRIALLGGSFNPPTIAHVLLARQLLDFSPQPIDEVWLMPNFGQSPPKENVASAEDRVTMTRMITMDRVKVSTIEIENKLSGRTIDLLPLLPPEHEYVFVIGADWLPNFSKWDHWEELVERIHFLVFPRKGYPNEPLHKNMTLVDHPLLMTSDVSATKVRARVKQGLSIAEFVPKGVAEYIKEKELYK